MKFKKIVEPLLVSVNKFCLADENLTLSPGGSFLWARLGDEFDTGTCLELGLELGLSRADCERYLALWKKFSWIASETDYHKYLIPSPLVSMKQLDDGIENFFGNISLTLVNLGGRMKIAPLSMPSEQVLVGAFYPLLRYFFSLPPRPAYRFWTLSSRHRRILIEIFNLPPEAVGVLPLITLPSSTKEGPASCFVYAGRLCESKGISKLIEAHGKLSDAKRLPLFLYAPTFSKRMEPIELKIRRQEFQSQGVYFMGDSGTELERIHLKNPCYVSFSLEPTEDFAISVRLARLKGWRLKVSDWGAHADIAASREDLISARAIADGNLDELTSFLGNWPDPNVIRNVPHPFSPGFITREELESRCRRLWEGEDFSFLDHFLASHDGHAISGSPVAKKIFDILSGAQL